jgi:hypothetical protein
MLAAARLKVTTVLNATELNAVAAPEGRPRITLRIRLPSRTVTAEIARQVAAQGTNGNPPSRRRQHRGRAAGPPHRPAT